ncbi:Protein-lysine methyltransferase C42C1.13 [Diplonema papillatum]|nr:Protein-lysine methyltransferase C42C1.13 [Diplonema papillatum]
MSAEASDSRPTHSIAYTEMQRAECVRFEDEAAGVRLSLRQGREMSVHEVVWQSAMLLSKYLCDHPQAVKGRRVVEVGSGIGLVGMVAAALGAESVLLTDVTESVALIRENIRANPPCGTTAATAEVLHWGNETDMKGLRAAADVVIAADCVYQQSADDLMNLASTIDHLLPHTRSAGNPGSVLLAYEHRGDWVDNVVFFDELARRGFKVDAQVSLEKYCPTPTDDLLLYSFSRVDEAARRARKDPLEFACADADGDRWRFREDVEGAGARNGAGAGGEANGANGGLSGADGGLSGADGANEGLNGVSGGVNSANGGRSCANAGLNSANGGVSSEGGLNSANGANEGLNGVIGGLNSANGGLNSANGGLNSANSSLNSANGGLNSANGGLNSANGGLNSANGDADSGLSSAAACKEEDPHTTCNGGARVFAYLNDARRPAVRSARVFSPTVVALDPPVPSAVRVAAFGEETLAELLRFFSAAGLPTVACSLPSVGARAKLLVDHYHDEEPFGLLGKEGDLAVITDTSACRTQVTLRLQNGQLLDTFLDAITEVPAP